MGANLAYEWTAADYRRLARPNDLVTFELRVKQTDMRVSAEADLRAEALALVLEARAQVERRIARCPEFLRSLVPLDDDRSAPAVIAAMLDAARRANVGPMAAVAGAIAEFVGRGLGTKSPEVIVENGGDLYLSSRHRRELTLLAENTAFGGIRITVPPAPEGAGIATSAGTLGHSLSFGNADAVMVVAESGALADALATAIGNIVQREADLAPALARARSMGARAAVIVADGHLAAFGDIELTG
ncbi:MAG: UPF0280 family protein [Burkholderiaceae bacterium]|nr:UPF0280 family protein [Burkholderiaceae bacterium]